VGLCVGVACVVDCVVCVVSVVSIACCWILRFVCLRHFCISSVFCVSVFVWENLFWNDFKRAQQLKLKPIMQLYVCCEYSQLHNENSLS